MNILNARVFTPEGVFVRRDIHTDGERFCAAPCGPDFQAGGLTAIPGLIDTHLHGAVGCDFMDASPASLAAMARFEAACGVTTLCPATMTMGEEDILAACRCAAAFVPGEDEAALAGIYMEGPFVAHSRLGAQHPAYVQPPSAELFRRAQQAAGGLIRVLALAPETDPQLSVLRTLSGEVTISIAHTDCDYELAAAALAGGARRLTHTYNAMPGIHHRSPGPILAAMDDPQCMAEIICDGIHVHPAAVRAAFRLFGADRMILISDSMMAAGLEDGRYTLGGQEVSVSGGRALLPSGSLAGSTATLLTCLQRCVRDMELPPEQAVAAATCNPARSLGLEGQLGCISPGARADLLLLDEDFELRGVMLRGRWLEQRHP